MSIFDREQVIGLLTRLVAIDSVNPSLVGGAAGERTIAAETVRLMRETGLGAWTDEFAPGRCNAIGKLAGSGGGKSLMLNAHVDTVGLGASAAPLVLRVEGDRAYGRGAYDMKGSLVSILLASQRLAQGPPLRGDVIITAVADEEYASLGTQRVLRAMTADAAIVTEPTGMQICVAHKGFAWIEIETEGRAAHGSKPDLGVDAIVHMGEVLVELHALSNDLARRPPHPRLATASLHASLIHGGQELSSYPARCVLQIERRTLPGETRSDIEEEVVELLATVKGKNPEFRGQSRVFFWRDAFEESEDSDVVKHLLAATRTVLGSQSAVVGETPWMDSAFTSAAGIPTVVFGPGGAGAHSDEEWVSISDIETCARVLVEMARSFCGQPNGR